MNTNKYPEHIMAILRQRLGLKINDTSKDVEINLYSPNEAFEEVLLWEGFIGYFYTIKKWIKDIYGIELKQHMFYTTRQYMSEIRFDFRSGTMLH